MWRAYVEQNFAMQGISIYLGMKHSDGMTMIKSVTTELQTLPEGAIAAPSLVMEDDLGRALLDALITHYGGATNVRQLRADYEHERGRVDKLIEHIMENG